MSAIVAFFTPKTTFPPLNGRYQTVGLEYMYFDTPVPATPIAVAADAIEASIVASTPVVNASDASSTTNDVAAPAVSSSTNGTPAVAAVVTPPVVATPLPRFPTLGVACYYPSSLSAPHPKSKFSQFLTPVASTALAAFINMPAFLFAALKDGRTRAVLNAPFATQAEEVATASLADVKIELKTEHATNGTAANGATNGVASSSSSSSTPLPRFPVVVFSHGLGGNSDMYGLQCVELASQGYVVFAPTHNDRSACIAILKDGATVTYQRVPAVGMTAEDLAVRQTQLTRRAEEVKFIVDYVETACNAAASPTPSSSLLPFASQLDLSRLAFVGHSFGAATVTLAATIDPRVKAVVAHDLWMSPIPRAIATDGLHVRATLLTTLSEEWTSAFPSNLASLTKMVNASTTKCTILSYTGTRHSNFSDVPMFSQYLSRKTGAIGPICFREGMASINRNQVAFLNHQMSLVDAPATDAEPSSSSSATPVWLTPAVLGPFVATQSANMIVIDKAPKATKSAKSK